MSTAAALPMLEPRQSSQTAGTSGKKDSSDGTSKTELAFLALLGLLLIGGGFYSYKRHKSCKAQGKPFLPYFISKHIGKKSPPHNTSVVNGNQVVNGNHEPGASNNEKNSSTALVRT